MVVVVFQLLPFLCAFTCSDFTDQFLSDSLCCSCCRLILWCCSHFSPCPFCRPLLGSLGVHNPYAPPLCVSPLMPRSDISSFHVSNRLAADLVSLARVLVVQRCVYCWSRICRQCSEQSVDCSVLHEAAQGFWIIIHSWVGSVVFSGRLE